MLQNRNKMKGLTTKYTVPRAMLAMLLIFPFIMQCKKKTDLDLSLAVNSNELHLEALEGKTNIMVYANGEWDLQFKEDVDWVSVDKLHGSGNSDVTFTYSQNFGGARKVTLILSKGNERQEILVVQKGLDVALRFAKTKFGLPKEGLPTVLPIISNLKYDLSQVEVEYLYDDETSEQWITNPRLTEEGFAFDALENTAGRNRTVRIYLSFVDGFGKEVTSFADIDQSLSPAFLTHKYNTSSQLTKGAKIDTVVLRGNVGVYFPDMEKEVVYTQGNDWIEQVTLANDSLLILAVRENSSGIERNADVQVRLRINGANLVTLTHHVYQSNEDFEEYNFEALRALIPGASGSVTINAPLKVLRGVVISNEGNPNMETNPNTAGSNGVFNQINFTETYKTAYIQSPDGKYGFRLKFPVQGDNTLKRYSKVNIVLHGLTLQKEANPTRYTIRGLTSASIAKSEPGSSVNVVDKLKYIAELTDDDMYTNVKIRNASMSIPYGGYMNTSGGYVRKTDWNTPGITDGGYADAIPNRIFDGQGENMNILVNASAPWARNTVPTGTGTIDGILTHDKLLRFGGGEGDIGRYTLRPVDLNSIQLNNPAIATTLVEWNWITGTGNTLCANATTVNKNGTDVLPIIGAGALSCTVPGASTGFGAHPICNTNPAHNGVYNNGFQFLGVKWWNADQNKGEGYVLRFSTSGITAQSLLLNFTMGGGSGSDATNHIPTYWEVEYSLDGTNYTVLPNSTYAIRPLTQWAAVNRPFQCPGLIPYTFKLPNSLLGKANVYVKLKAQSNICATTTGAENGVITSAMAGTSMRVGVVSIKYIQ